jgi:hypothetical protein
MIARLRAALRLLSPGDITPMGVRIIEKILDEEEKAVEESRKVLDIWTIYDHPLDYPDGYVVRLWHVGPDGMERSTEAYGRATLEEARAMVPEGLYRMPAETADDKTILESWL